MVKINGGYFKGDALSYFNVLTAINFHYISIGMKQNYYKFAGYNYSVLWFSKNNVCAM